MLSTFSRTVSSYLLPSKLHNVIFHGLKSHTPFPGLFAQLINILLEFRCVFSAINQTIADTVISEQTNRYFHDSNHDVIYIQGKQQWTENSALLMLDTMNTDNMRHMYEPNTSI